MPTREEIKAAIDTGNVDLLTTWKSAPDFDKVKFLSSVFQNPATKNRVDWNKRAEEVSRADSPEQNAELLGKLLSLKDKNNQSLFNPLTRDKFQSNLLMSAVTSRPPQVPIINLLLDLKDERNGFLFNEKELNVPTRLNEQTVLHEVAIRSELSEIGKKLIERGADPKSYNKNEETPLHCALQFRNQAFTEYLLTITDKDRKLVYDKPFHFACAAGANEFCQQLIKKGYDPKQRDEDGRTPLDHALFEQKYDTVIYLGLPEKRYAISHLVPQNLC